MMLQKTLEIQVSLGTLYALPYGSSLSSEQDENAARQLDLVDEGHGDWRRDNLL